MPLSRPFSTTCLAGVLACILALHAGDAFAAVNQKGEPGRKLVGMKLTYRLRYRSEGYTELRNAIEAGSESQASPRHNLLASLEAKEILTFLDGDRGLVRASVRFEKPLIKIQVDSKSQSGQERKIIEELGHSTVVYFDAQCRVTRLELPKEY